MKYCEDVNCPNLGSDIGDPTDCRLGFHNPLRTPRSIDKAVRSDWGHLMPKICRVKFKRESREVKGESSGRRV